MKKKCFICHKYFQIPRYKPLAKFCSKKCRIKGNGKLSAFKRGEIMRGRGAGKSYRKFMGYHEHRVVMENKIGRSLKKGEIVHHIDGNHLNNDPKNLTVTNRSDHARHHSTKYNSKCSIGKCAGKHYGKGYCLKHFTQIKRNGKIYEQINYVERVASRRKKC